MECIKTNVHGAENVIHAALECEVEKVIAFVDRQSCESDQPLRCNQAMFRQAVCSSQHTGWIPPHALLGGAVWQCRGITCSVVPHFQSRIESNADHLPITDERMTRFWITLQQGVDFCAEEFRPNARGRDLRAEDSIDPNSRSGRGDGAGYAGSRNCHSADREFGSMESSARRSRPLAFGEILQHKIDACCKVIQNRVIRSSVIGKWSALLSMRD